MKFFKRIIGLLLFFTCMGYPAEAKVIHQDMCQMSTAYEDQMHIRLLILKKEHLKAVLL